MIDHHKIKPVIDAVYPFHEAREAFTHLDQGAFGKVVIAVKPC
jgi:NADPH:quinone reductase-like Zn-dependent oxidoreductase